MRFFFSSMMAGAAAGMIVAGPARADAVADFYKGRSITWILSTGEGGGYASYARAFAPHLEAA